MTLSPFRELITALLAAALLAGCSAQSAGVPAQTTQLAPSSLYSLATRTVRPDSKPIPACKGQKDTKQYAESKPEALSDKGGSGCIPKFKNWGGSIKYPGFSPEDVSMTVISSTTAYDIDFPPSTNAMFYVQLQFSANVKFDSALPAGPSLASSELKIKKPYTIEGAEPFGSLWNALPDCYTTAVEGTYGPTIGGLGYPLKGEGVNGAVIMVYAGKLTTTKC